MLQVDKLQFHYPNGRMILDDVSLSLTHGNIYGLFGRNGEGKSTLIKLMTGLLFPKSGSCYSLGEDTSKRPVKGLQDMFLIPEDFELPKVKIATYERINAPFYPNFSKDEFYRSIKEFGLAPHENIASLSFGQKKKVLIAFGIATNTQFLLMDEPTNGLDIPSKSQFRKIMATIVDQGKCVIIATHQVRDLHSLINHVVILDQSKVIFDQSLSSVSEALWFGRPHAGDEDDIIYSESSFGGRVVLPLKNKEESDIDLELLFNAVLEAPQKIDHIIKTTAHASV